MGYLLGIFTTIIWAGNFTLALVLVDTIAPFTFTFWRWFIATIIIAIIFYPHIKNNLHIIKKHILFLNACGLLGISFYHSLVYFSAHHSSATNIALISACAPIFVIIGNKFITKEVFGVQRVFGLILVIGGLLVLISNGSLQAIINLEFRIGDLWMLLGAINFAAYNILVEHKPKEIHQKTLTSMMFIFGTLWLTPFYLYEILENMHTFALDVQNIGMLFYTAIFASVVAYFIWHKAIGLIRSSNTAIMYFTVPIFTAIFAYIFLGDGISMVQITSMVFMIVGILLSVRKKQH